MSFDADVCRRLPLADATLSLLDHVADAEFLAGLFERHRGRCYEKHISFADIVHLLADSLALDGRSAHRVFKDARKEGELPVSIKAAYDKLARMPPNLSCALLTEGAARLRPVLPEGFAERVPESLKEFAPLAFDGKKIKFVAHRLKATRGVSGHVLGGKLLVAEDVRTGLAAAMEADPDGEASDLALVTGLLARARTVVAGPRLWVGDRLFCDLNLPQFASAGDHFVVRYQAKVKFHADAGRPVKHGTNRLGQNYVEEFGRLGGAKDPRSFAVRRVTVLRPGAEDVSVVTSLLDADRYPAADILDMYLRRWGIERLFQKITDVFQLRALVSARENGTVFQAALCLLLYNLTMVVRAHVAEGAKRAAEEVSTEKLFGDMCRQLSAGVEMLGASALAARYVDGAWTADSLRGRLAVALGGIWREWWEKSPPRKPSAPTPRQPLEGGHSSVYRIVRGLHRLASEPTAKKTKTGRSKAAKTKAKKKTSRRPRPSKQ